MMENKAINFSIKIKTDYDYVSYQCESYFRKLTNQLKQNPYSLIEVIYLENNSDVDLNNLKIQFNFSNNIIRISELDINYLKAHSKTQISEHIFTFIDTQTLIKISEGIITTLEVTLSSANETYDRQVFTILLNPFNESGAIKDDLCMLASFVTPNADEISMVVSRGVEKLKKIRPKFPSFIGYQANDTDSVREEMMAIFNALHDHGIVYSNPPASFNQFQKVRTPSQVLNEYKGTCLDLAILYCACLEYIGLNPLLILIDGHAFAGCFLDDSGLIEKISTDRGKIYNQSAEDLQKIELVECTCFPSSVRFSYNDATKTARRSLSLYRGSFYAIDIRICHHDIFKPLPTQKMIDSNEFIIDIKSKQNNEKLERHNSNNDGSYFVGDPLSNDKFAYWAKKLLDLSLRNKLINFRFNKSAPQLHTGTGFSFLNFILKKDKINLVPTDTDVLDDYYHNIEGQNKDRSTIAIYCEEKQLKLIFRNANTTIEETGSNPLYLTIGLLDFTPKDSKRAYIAPIFLIPAKGKWRRGMNGYEVNIETDEITINTTVFEYLKQNYQISFDELYNVSKENIEEQVETIINAIRAKTSPLCSISVVLDKVFISSFSFAHYIMWDDIKNRREELLKNDIIHKFCNGTIYEDTDNSNFEHLDDLAIPLGADSSQINAIKASLAGQSFVLDGPPGTGKSQTIVNMIVNAFYHGKSVLFVAEKMAALQVVKKRLDDISLGCFCLELHSNKANKRDVLSQLGAALDNEKIKSPDEFIAAGNTLENNKTQLDLLLAKMQHKILLESFHDCIIKYLTLTDYDLNINDQTLSFLNYDDDSIKIILDLIGNYLLITKNRGEYYENPFRYFELDNYSFTRENELKDLLTALNNKIDSLNKLPNTITDHLPDILFINHKHYKTLHPLLNLIYHKQLTLNTLYSDEIYNTNIINIEVLRLGIINNELTDKLKRQFTEGIFNYPAQVKLDYLSSLKDRKFKYFFAKRKLIKELKKLLIKKIKINHESLYVILNDLIQLNNNQSYINQNNSFLKKLFKDDYDMLTNNYKLMGELYNNTLSFKQNMDSIQFNELDERIAFLTQCNKLINKLKSDDIFNYSFNTTLNIINDIKVIEDKLISEFKFVPALLTYNSEQFLINYQVDINNMITNIKKIEDISMLNKVINNLIIRKFPSELLNMIKFNRADSINFEKYFFAFLYKNLINEYLKDPYYSEFNGLLFNDAIIKYNKLIEEYRILTIKETASRITKNYPSQNHKYGKSTEVYNLNKYIKNGGHRMTIRSILHQFENLVRETCPCFLMSPMSAAQYLSVKSKKFDLVIFDEASQIPTSEAIGTISRGNTLIVAGDPEQMPPTNFFKTSFGSDDIVEYTQNFDDLESLLDDCLALKLPRHRLLWHYRSQHESLIAFSNNAFYNHSLYTFPSPDDKLSRVKFNYLPDAIYDNGINRVEAKNIIEEVKRRFADPILAKKSIGIVTFNIKQQELILESINDLFEENTAFYKINEENIDKLFVKNLENVQGDERDVIMFSIGFGYNKENKFNLNFGPLSLDKGERRLNVAVTRAREEMIVFSSIKGSDIDPSKAKNNGALYLKQFLDYAQKGSSTLILENSKQEKLKDGIELFLKKDLELLGYEIELHVGVSKFKIDLCIKGNEGQYLLAVLIDNKEPVRAFSCQDRYNTQEKVLKRLKWQYIRIYTMDYFKNKEQVISDIINAANTSVSIQHPSIPKITFEKEEIIINKRAVDEYIKYTPKRIYNYDSYKSERADSGVVNELNSCIEFEGPIAHDLLLERFKEIFKITKAGSRVKRLFEINASNLNSTLAIEPSGKVYYPNDPIKSNMYRLSAPSERDVSLIPATEIKAALLDLLEVQRSIRLDELIKMIGNTFGMKNITATTEVKIKDILLYVIETYDKFDIKGEFIGLRGK